MKKKELLAEIAEYYTSKLAQYGETARGVDWNGEESQTLRFKQLCKIINNSDNFSINDIGCGYGAFFDFIENTYKDFSYLGVDISEGMIEAAEKRYKGNLNARFIVSSSSNRVADFSVASGIYNVRLGKSDDEWKAYIETALDALNQTSRLGFAFNCLTSYSDLDKRRDHLYYADPCTLFNFCKKRYSLNVALLHDYSLYEFTILVRKEV